MPWLRPARQKSRKKTLSSAMYEIGLEIGRQWARRDATREQLVRVSELGSGRDWIESRREPADELALIIDPAKKNLVGTGENPSPSFVAGFIDGARAISR